MTIVRRVFLGVSTLLLGGNLCWSEAPLAQTAEEVLWESVKSCTLASEVGAYLEAFPTGRYVGAARACLVRLRSALARGGTVFRDCPACPEMVVVPAGSFIMGSDEEVGDHELGEGPKRRVTIGRAFAVGKFEVKRSEFAFFVNETGYKAKENCHSWKVNKWVDSGSWRDPGFVQDDGHPVVCTSWVDAKAYVDWLSRLTGKPYRLLSEAEWEYAARAGTETRYHWGDDFVPNRANCRVCGSRWDGKGTAPSGSFDPNGFGLYDMLGNASEWVEDCASIDHRNAPSDGSARTPAGGYCSMRYEKAGDVRVLRGGGHRSEQRAVRATIRHHDNSEPHQGFMTYGFRVALTLS